MTGAPEVYEDAPPEIVRAMGDRVPTLQQWEAISHPLDPCSVVAGAGSGKTAVMAARVVYLVLVRQSRLEADHPGALPSSVLCLTFTNKAAEELARRVRRATEGLGLPEGEEATVHTYHAFASRLLDDYGLRAGLEAEQMLLTDAQRWQIAEALLADREFGELEIRTVGHVVSNMLHLADQCANHLVDPRTVAEEDRKLAESIAPENATDRDMRTTALKRAELAELAAAYAERKRERSAIDYGDQIELASRLVEDHPEVAEEFRRRFAVVLLDEYQDTNVAQAQLLQGLCGRGYPVFAVGDPDQNIYAWRGATLGNILRFHEDFGSPGQSARRPLYVNFRSGSRILAVADEVIGRVPDERRAAEKVLLHHPPLGEGRVQAFVAADERAEARRMAGMIKDLLGTEGREGPLEWDDFVVLCRKKRLFGAIVEVFREEGVPAEVVDLGGLLALPEVVEAVAWLRVLENPADNVSLARILQGPRWRIGFRDLVALARWSMRRNLHMGVDLEEDPRPGDVRFALVEALDHVRDPEMEGLSDDARDRLEEVSRVLAGLRDAATRPLGDLVSEVIERSGLLRELETSPAETARSARRNLLNLVDHVASFAPVEGEASLSTLIDYLDMAEEAEDELEPVQPATSNTVKIMTIHKAKGLEWPVVFVPGLAEHDGRGGSMFPDVSRQPNPVTQFYTLPFHLRGDRAVLPTFDGDLRRFREELKDRGREEERRLCYVALTRAQDLLVASSAYWYTGPQDPYRPADFFEEIAAHDACEVLGRDECPEDNPLLAVREARAKLWPAQARRDDADELFPEGWHAAAVDVTADPEAVSRWAERLGPAVVADFRKRHAADVERVELIRRRTGTRATPALPASLSVSSVLDYLKCPKLFFWSHVRPLPRKPNPKARLGSKVHKWIELQSVGQTTLIEADEAPDLSADERLGEPGSEETMRRAFKRSRFSEKVPLFTERPFLLYLDGFTVGGRIDAVFGTMDGPWEVVDYKTGRVADPDNPLTGLQLDLYALACIEVWGKRPEDLTLTYFYLSDGTEDTRPAGDPEDTRKRVTEALAAMAEERFDPTPGEQCNWCDFLTFCEAGRRFVGSS